MLIYCKDCKFDTQHNIKRIISGRDLKKYLIHYCEVCYSYNKKTLLL